MGRRSRQERRARRKRRKAAKKIRKAEKWERRGKTAKANRKRRKAEKKNTKAANIEVAINAGVIRGLHARSMRNANNNVLITAEWNYQANELNYERLRLSLAPSSPFRPGNRQVHDIDVNLSSFSFGLTRNFTYTIKLFGVNGGKQTLIDRMILDKIK